MIDVGLDKLGIYRNCAELVPAYILAMSTYFFSHCQALANLFLVLTPSTKLKWYTDNEPDKAQWAKDIFMEAMSLYCPSDYTHSDIHEFTASALPY